MEAPAAARAADDLQEPPRAGSRLVRWVAMLLLLAALTGAGYALTRWQPPATAASTAPPGKDGVEGEEAAVREVRLEPAELTRLTQPIQVTGTLKSDDVVELNAKATGVVREVRAREGDRVRAGQLLVRIDDSENQAQLARAEAAVRVAEARLKQAITNRRIQDQAVRSEHENAKETLAAAQVRLSQARSLAGITGTELDNAVETARSAVQAARERVKVLRDGARRQEKASAELAVQRAQANVDKLRGNLERREMLLKERAASREEVENARRDLEAAQAELKSLREQADLVGEGPRSEEIRIAEEQLRQAETQLKTAEANRARRRISDEDVVRAETEVRQAESALKAAEAALGRIQWNEDEIQSARALLGQARADVRYYQALIAETRVYSPVDGVVTRRVVQVGQTVNQMKNDLFTLVATGRLVLEATAPETVAPFLRPGGEAEVELDALPGRTMKGVIREVIPVAGEGDRSVRLRIALPRASSTRVVVGGFGRATVRGVDRSPVLTIPRSAVVTEEGAFAAYLVRDGKAVRRPVRVGTMNAARAAILSGLEPGDEVILAADGLTEGQPVRPVR